MDGTPFDSPPSPYYTSPTGASSATGWFQVLPSPSPSSSPLSVDLPLPKAYLHEPGTWALPPLATAGYLASAAAHPDAPLELNQDGLDWYQQLGDLDLCANLDLTPQVSADDAHSITPPVVEPASPPDCLQEERVPHPDLRRDGEGQVLFGIDHYAIAAEGNYLIELTRTGDVLDVKPPRKKVKREQVSRACVECAKINKKCSPNHPCDRCKDRGLECVPVTRKRDEKKKAQAAALRNHTSAGKSGRSGTRGGDASGAPVIQHADLATTNKTGQSMVAQSSATRDRASSGGSPPSFPVAKQGGAPLSRPNVDQRNYLADSDSSCSSTPVLAAAPPPPVYSHHPRYHAHPRPVAYSYSSAQGYGYDARLRHASFNYAPPRPHPPLVPYDQHYAPSYPDTPRPYVHESALSSRGGSLSVPGYGAPSSFHRTSSYDSSLAQLARQSARQSAIATPRYSAQHAYSTSHERAGGYPSPPLPSLLPLKRSSSEDEEDFAIDARREVQMVSANARRF